MPPRSRGPQLDPDVQADAAALALALGIPVSAAVSAALDAQSNDPQRAQKAQRELMAWRLGTAVPVRNLPAVGVPTMLARLGPYVEDEQESPFTRSGYGVRAGAPLSEIAASLRGFWGISAAHSCHPARLIGYRRGSILMHAWADEWQREGSKFWASRFYYVDGGEWVDADTGARFALEPENAEVDRILRSVPAVIPSSDRNPFGWVEVQSQR